MINRNQRVYLGFILFCILLMIFSCIVTYLKYQQDYKDQIKVGINKTANLAIALAEHTNISVKSVNQVLDQIQSIVKKLNKLEDIKLFLQDSHCIQQNLISKANVINDKGIVIFSNYKPFKQYIYRDKSLVDFHKNQNDELLYIHPTIKDPLTGKWIIPMTMRLENKSGEFIGVVEALVNPYYFVNIYHEIQSMSSCTIKLVDYSGDIIAGYTDYYEGPVTDLFGKNASHLSFKELVKKGKNGWFISVSTVDGIERIRSYRTIVKYKLIISVAISTKDLFKDYRVISKRFLIFTIIFNVFILFIILLLNQQRLKDQRNSRLLLENQEKYRVLFEAESDAIIILNRKSGKIVEVNKAAQSLYGYSRLELLQMNIFELSGNPQSSKESLLTETKFIPIRIHKKRDQTTFPIEAAINTFFIEGEEYIITAIRDISDRKSYEDALKQSEERFRLAMEATSDGVWDWNLSNNKVYFSPRYYTMLGYEPYEYPQTVETWKRFLHPDDADSAVSTVFEEIKRKSENYNIEFRMLNKKGDTVWINGRARAVEWDEEGYPTRLVGTNADITDRKKFAELLEQRILALTQPLGDTSDIQLSDLFDIRELQKIQDAFSEITGVASIITDVKGIPITKPSNFCYLCEHVIRKTEKGLQNCYHSDAVIGSVRKDGPIMQPCLSGGLWDGGTSICVGDKHIANWLIGQVVDQNIDFEKIVDYAEVIGVDRELFRTELAKVNQMPKEKFENVCNALFLIAKQLSLLAAQNIQQARYITDFKKAKEAIQKAEDRLQSFIENVEDMVYFQDLDGSITILNNAVSLITGYSIEEYTKDVFLWQNIIHLEDGKLAREFFEKYSQEKAVNDVEYRLTSKDGQLHWIQSKMVAVYNDKNDIIGYNCIGRDITERKLAEIDLHESNQKLNALINSSPLGIMVLDLDKNVIFWNSSCENIFGYKAEEVLGLPIKVVQESKKDEFDKFINSIKKGESYTGVEITRIRKDGSNVNLRSWLSPLYDMNNKVEGVIGILQDITEIILYEEEQTRLREQMQHTQKLESLGVLAGGIAHDFNNLLMAIMGNVDLAMDKLTPNTEVFEYLKDVDNAARRAAELTKQMLAYSGKGKLIVQNLQLNDVVQDMSNILNVSISKKAQLCLKFDPDIPIIKADAAQIRQIVMNLIINASEAIGDKPGSICLKTGLTEVKSEQMDAFWRNENLPEGLYVFLEVNDNGSGMSTETINKIFDPFFTTKFTGRGLGLAAVLGIVRGHQGFIQVESILGKGTTFKVFFPPVWNEDLTVQTSNHKDNSWRGTGRLLLVDDDASVREIGKRMFENLGFKVIIAENGKIALDIYKDNQEFVCIVLDLTMPVMDGVEAFNELRKINPDVKVIIASGYNEQEISTELINNGLNGFIQKPYHSSEIKEKLSKILN